MSNNNAITFTVETKDNRSMVGALPIGQFFTYEQRIYQRVVKLRGLAFTEETEDYLDNEHRVLVLHTALGLIESLPDTTVVEPAKADISLELHYKPSAPARSRRAQYRADSGYNAAE